MSFSKEKIKVISFDADGTLFDFDRVMKHSLMQVLIALNDIDSVAFSQLSIEKLEDIRNEVAEACLGQTMAANSAVTFVWTALIERSMWKYLQRCYRYIYMDCGHIGQNFYLVSEALHLGACTIGAIFDDELNTLLNLDGTKETAIYVGVVGKVKSFSKVKNH